MLLLPRDQKKAAPSLKEISVAHRGHKGAEAKLLGVLKSGKRHPKIEASDVQLKTVIQYVLKQQTSGRHTDAAQEPRGRLRRQDRKPSRNKPRPGARPRIEAKAG